MVSECEREHELSRSKMTWFTFDSMGEECFTKRLYETNVVAERVEVGICLGREGGQFGVVATTGRKDSTLVLLTAQSFVSGMTV